MSSQSSPSAGSGLTRLKVESQGEVTIMSFPKGEVDGVAVREMYENVAQLMDQRDLKLLVDFSGVPMASSAVMGMLVTIKKKCLSCGGQFHVVIPDPNVMGAFKVMNLHLILNLFPSVEEAGAKFK